MIYYLICIVLAAFFYLIAPLLLILFKNSTFKKATFDCSHH